MENDRLEADGCHRWENKSLPRWSKVTGKWPTQDQTTELSKILEQDLGLPASSPESFPQHLILGQTDELWGEWLSQDLGETLEDWEILEM